MRILDLLILEELVELRSDFTGKYITERVPSQVTVLRMYKSRGTENAEKCGTQSLWDPESIRHPTIIDETPRWTIGHCLLEA